MTDLNNLAPGELLRWMPIAGTTRRAVVTNDLVWAEIRRRLDELAVLKALYAASEILRQQMNEQAAKDLGVFNKLRERLEKTEETLAAAEKRLAKCEAALKKYMQHLPSCNLRVFGSYVANKDYSKCSCGYEAASAALEGK